jgi:hypothetical protein
MEIGSDNLTQFFKESGMYKILIIFTLKCVVLNSEKKRHGPSQGALC